MYVPSKAFVHHLSPLFSPLKKEGRREENKRKTGEEREGRREENEERRGDSLRKWEEEERKKKEEEERKMKEEEESKGKKQEKRKMKEKEERKEEEEKNRHSLTLLKRSELIHSHIMLIVMDNIYIHFRIQKEEDQI